MKKKLVVFLTVLAGILAFSVVGCKPKKPIPVPGTPANVRVEQSVLKWDASENAESYTVMVNTAEVSGITATELSLSGGDAASYITEGNNTLKVKAVAGDKESGYSAEVTYTYTVATEQLTAPVISFDPQNDNRVVWTAVANAAGYKINIDGTDKLGQVVNTYYDFSVNVTAAVIKIKAVGIGRYTDSGYSNTLNYSNENPQKEKLSTPAPKAEKNVISWAPVPQAASYSLKLNDGAWTPAESPYTIDITDAGDYKVSVKAISDGILYTDSDAGEVTVKVIKLATPALTEDGLTVRWTNISGAVEYYHSINGGEWTLSENNAVTIEKPQTAGAWTVEVYAAGGEGDVTVLKSDTVTHTLTFVKLATPTGLAYTHDGYLEWTCDGATKFEITVLKDNTAQQPVTVTNAKIYKFSYTEGGTYKFSVKAIAASALEIDGEVSEVLETAIVNKAKLDTPTVTIKNTNTVSWNVVSGAESYTVSVQKNNDTPVEITNITATEYTLMDTGTGVYKIKVMAVPNAADENALPSDYSAAQTITVTGQLTAPVLTADVSQGNKIIWDAVSGADKYYIYKNGNKIKEITENVYTVSGVGEHKITVKAASDNTAVYSDSEFSNEIIITITKLTVTLSVTGRTVSWTANPNAVGYEYRIGTTGNWNTVTAGQNSVEVSAAAGSFTVQVRAVGDDKLYITSDVAEKVITVTKLTVKDIDSAAKTVSWSADANATFEVSLNGTDYNQVSGNTYTLTDNTAGSYTVYVRAVGKTDNYLTSDSVTRTITITKLTKPTGVVYDKLTGQLSWSGNAESYKISVTKDGVPTDYTANAASYDLSLAEAGEYSITVTGLSSDNNVLVLDSDPSDSISVTIEEAITKLEIPKNASITGTELSWDAVEHATGYEISVTGSSTATYKATTNTYTLELGAGSYTIKVRATAEGIASSDFTEGIPYIVQAQLAKSTISQNGKAISWTQVPNATGYKVSYTVDGTTTVLYEKTELLSHTFELSAPLIAMFKVTALGDGTIYTDSAEATMGISVTIQLTAPVVACDETNRKLTVTANANAVTKYRYYKSGMSAGIYQNYPASGIPYGTVAGDFVLDVMYTANGGSGWTDSEAVVATYTVLAAPVDIKIEVNKISFKANATATGFMIRDNGGALVELNAEVTLASGMHRFYISATGGDNVLRSTENYYTVLMISTVTDFNLLPTKYTADGSGNAADNMWGVASLINDIPNPTGIKAVTRADTDYKGFFMGNGFTIGSAATPLTVAGLFGKNCGTIIDLKLYVNINAATVSYTGGVATENWFRIEAGEVITGLIRNVKVYGTVKGKDHVGGIVGANMGDIFDCANYAAVTGGEAVGGIAGENKAHTIGGKINNGYIRHAVNEGAVTGGSYVGGIVGTLSSNGIEGGYNKGRVSGTTGAWGVGGIAGYGAKDTVIFNSMNAGEVGLLNNNYDVGGIVGKLGNNPSDGWENAGIANCVNIGQVNNGKPGGEGPAYGLLVGNTWAWAASGTSVWDTRGVANCAYLTPAAGVTVAVGVSNNVSLNPVVHKVARGTTEAAAQTLCNTMNAADMTTTHDTFTVAVTGGNNFYVTLGWVAGLSL